MAEGNGSHHQAATKEFIPRLIFWEVTKGCNLRCIHCRATATELMSPADLPTSKALDIIRQIAAFGNPNVVLCPRGTSPALDGYRNHPDESITPLLKEKTWAPVIVDPSHSVGKASYVPACALAAVAYGADGLCIEAHVDPSHGIGDDPKQALTPDVLAETIIQAKQIWNLRRPVKTG